MSDKKNVDTVKSSTTAGESNGSNNPKKYPSGNYTIRIFGRTQEVGIGKISEEQYEFWDDPLKESDLNSAINGELDYDEHNIPESARFSQTSYDEFSEVASIYGLEMESAIVTISNASGAEIFRGDFYELFKLADPDDEWHEKYIAEVDEMYPLSFGEGYYLMYKNGGKGYFFQHELVLSEGLDLTDFRIENVDVDGERIIKSIYYRDVEINDEGVDDEYNNWRGQWSTVSVHSID